MANQAARPCIYLEQSTTRDGGQRKEDMARKIVVLHGIDSAWDPRRLYTLEVRMGHGIVTLVTGAVSA
jgi:hypothetical protein